MKYLGYALIFTIFIHVLFAFLTNGGVMSYLHTAITSSIIGAIAGICDYYAHRQ